MALLATIKHCLGETGSISIPPPRPLRPKNQCVLGFFFCHFLDLFLTISGQPTRGGGAQNREKNHSLTEHHPVGPVWRTRSCREASWSACRTASAVTTLATMGTCGRKKRTNTKAEKHFEEFQGFGGLPEIHKHGEPGSQPPSTQPSTGQGVLF